MREKLSLTIGEKTLSIPTANRRQFLKAAAASGAAWAWAASALAAEETTKAPEGKKVKVAQIGCGSVSHAYLPYLKETPHVELVSVCDIIPERAKKAAEEHHLAHHFPNIDALLAGPHFDLLVNTTSMPSHYPVNRKALEAGRNVWSEKPMALEVSDATSLLELAKKNNVRIWGSPDCVLSPQFKFMYDAIAGGRIGRVTAGHGTYGHGGPTWSGWFYEKGGGCLYDLGVYNVTTLTGLLGPVKEVVGMTEILNETRKVDDKGQVKVTADENTMLIMNHGRGVLSHVQTGFVYYEPERQPAREKKLYTIDIMGTQGAMHLQGWDWGPAGVDIADHDEPILRTESKKPGDYHWVGGASYVAKCLLTGEKSLIQPEHAVHVLEVMNACHESQRTGKRVEVKSTFKWPIFG